MSQQPDDVDARFNDLVRGLDLGADDAPLPPPARTERSTQRPTEPFSLEAALDAAEPEEAAPYRPTPLPPARFTARGVLVAALAAVAGVIAIVALLGVVVPVLLGAVAVASAVAALAIGLSSLRTTSHPGDDDGARV